MPKTEAELIAKRKELMSRDADHMELISNYGVDLDKKRQIDLNFWAPTQETADRFVEACTKNEMPPHTVLGPTASEKNRRWLIRCPISASVTFVVAKENVVTFLLFADKYDCEYDGWGTAIVEAAGIARPNK